MKVEIETVKKLLEMSKEDIYIEDLLGENGVEEDSEEEQMLYETFYEVKDFVIGRLELRLKFMEIALKDKPLAERTEQGWSY